MKITPIDLIKVNKGFYRESDLKNNYLVESKKVKVDTTPEGLEEHTMLVTVVIQPKDEKKD